MKIIHQRWGGLRRAPQTLELLEDKNQCSITAPIYPIWVYSWCHRCSNYCCLQVSSQPSCCRVESCSTTAPSTWDQRSQVYRDSSSWKVWWIQRLRWWGCWFRWTHSRICWQCQCQWWSRWGWNYIVTLWWSQNDQWECIWRRFCKSDWSNAIKDRMLVSISDAMLQSFLPEADNTLKQMKEERDNLDSIFGLKTSTKQTSRSNSNIKNKQDSSTAIWCNTKLINTLVKARVKCFPWWPAHICIPLESVVADALPGSGYLWFHPLTWHGGLHRRVRWRSIAVQQIHPWWVAWGEIIHYLPWYLSQSLFPTQL